MTLYRNYYPHNYGNNICTLIFFYQDTYLNYSAGGGRHVINVFVKRLGHLCTRRFSNVGSGHDAVFIAFTFYVRMVNDAIWGNQSDTFVSLPGTIMKTEFRLGVRSTAIN